MKASSPRLRSWAPIAARLSVASAKPAKKSKMLYTRNIMRKKTFPAVTALKAFQSPSSLVSRSSLCLRIHALLGHSASRSTPSPSGSLTIQKLWRSQWTYRRSRTIYEPISTLLPPNSTQTCLRSSPTAILSTLPTYSSRRSLQSSSPTIERSQQSPTRASSAATAARFSHLLRSTPASQEQNENPRKRALKPAKTRTPTRPFQWTKRKSWVWTSRNCQKSTWRASWT